MSVSYRTHSTARRGHATAVLVGTLVVAALLGAAFALALHGDKRKAPAPATTAPAGAVVAAGDLRFTLPRGWAPAGHRLAIPGFEGARAAFARSGIAEVAIALLAPASPSLLPPELDAARSIPAGPRTIRTGRLRVHRDLRAIGDDRVVAVYTVPTTLGIATIACSMTIYTYAPGECDLAPAGLRLTRGSFLPLTDSAAFLARLPEVVMTLNAERDRLRARLGRAARTDGAVRTALRLGRAYAAAARALRPLVTPRTPASATVRLLKRLRVEHVALARTLRARDRANFAFAARAIRSDEGQLADQLTRWQGLLPGGPGEPIS
jgi:type IV secretory pathway protease TraF